MSQIKFQLQPESIAQTPSASRNVHLPTQRQIDGTSWLGIRRNEATKSAIWAIVLTIIFGGIYARTETRYYSVDAVRVAEGIVVFHHTHSLTALFSPGYLLFGPLGLSIERLGQIAGLHWQPLQALQSINCVAGAMGIGLMSIVLRQILTRSRSLTVLMPIALGLSFGYWMLATDGRPEMPSIYLVLLTMCLLVRVMLVPTWQRSIGAGLALSSAILFHVMALLFLPAAVVAIAMASYTQGDLESERRARGANICAFIGAVLAPTAIVYAWTGLGLLGLHSVHGWSLWFHQGFETDWWISPHTGSDLRLDTYSLRRALFVEPGLKSGTFHLELVGSNAPAALYWLSLSVWFVALYLIASNTAFMMRTHYRPYMAVSITAIITNTVAFTYICPGYFVYWTPIVVFSSLIMAICMSYYRGRRHGVLWLVGIGCWSALFGFSNYLLFIKPHLSATNNPWMQQAIDIRKHTLPGDLIIVSGDEDTQIVEYAPYFVHRKVFSLRDSLEEHNGDVVLTSRDLIGAVDAAQAIHRHAYAYADIWSDPDTRTRLSAVSQEYNPQQVFVGLQRAKGWQNPIEPGGFVWKLIPSTNQATDEK